MKKNLNVIQIKGFKGILYLIFIGCCFAAGFGWFPGWSCMKLWNFACSYYPQIPTIGIFQGILLWGIIAAAYFTFRKERVVVCMKNSDGLSEEELKAVFADMKKHMQDDTFMRSMLKAHDAELKIKKLSESDIPGVNGVNIKEIKKESTANNYSEHNEIETK